MLAEKTFITKPYMAFLAVSLASSAGCCKAATRLEHGRGAAFPPSRGVKTPAGVVLPSRLPHNGLEYFSCGLQNPLQCRILATFSN
jgi:hypothetical protein